MSNKNVEVFVKEDFLEKFDDLKFGFNKEQGPYLVANCADPKEIELITETLHEIWYDICCVWVSDNLSNKGYVFCFDFTWDGSLPTQQASSFSVSLSNEVVIQQLHVSEETVIWGAGQSSELLVSMREKAFNEVVKISLNFLDEVMTYFAQQSLEAGYE